MARVFLSYAREDVEVARKLAGMLTDAGQAVWWDRHLHGGANFGNEIDRELKSAQIVMVLWSAASIGSAWVQDEAAEGRDTGRLVPAVIDAVKPPLGFRQLQCIDLSSWTKDGKIEVIDDVLQAIAKVAGDATDLSQSVAAAAQTPISICVLPFLNLSDDTEQEYFSDGITEDIITDLSKVSALSVVARNTAFAFKGEVRDVARELGVSHVLEGSVRKAGDRVRITAQLIDGAAGDHVWAERYDRELTDIFALQDEISMAIVTALKLKLLPQEKQAIERRGTDSVEAYDLYLMARSYYLTGNYGDPRRDEAIERLSRQAVEIDPGYAQAWALLASGQATLHRLHGRPGDGAAALERALALDPDLAEARALKAGMLSHAGRREEAAAEIVAALRLDPESYEVNFRAAAIRYTEGRLNDAARHYEKAAALSETSVDAHQM